MYGILWSAVGLAKLGKSELGDTNLHSHVTCFGSARKPGKRNLGKEKMSQDLQVWWKTWKMWCRYWQLLDPTPACPWNHYLVSSLCSLLISILLGVVSILHNGRASTNISGFLFLKSLCNMIIDGILESSEEEHNCDVYGERMILLKNGASATDGLSTYQDSMNPNKILFNLWDAGNKPYGVPV